MKVSELIEALDKCPPDFLVYSSGEDLDYVIVRKTETIVGDDGESDNVSNYVEIG